MHFEKRPSPRALWLLLWMASCASLLLGCTTMDHNIHPLLSAYSKAPPSELPIFVGPGPIGEPFVEIAKIEVLGADGSTQKELRERMIQTAVELRADAVINLTHTTTTRSKYSTKGIFGALTALGNLSESISGPDDDCPPSSPYEEEEKDFTAGVLRGTAIVYEKNLVNGRPPPEPDEFDTGR